MRYPYRICERCGWEPEGKYLDKAKDFARLYEYKHGIDKNGKKGPSGNGPRLVKPPPDKDIERIERILDPNKMNCPVCGGGIDIHSSRRPLKVSCRNCGAKVRIQEYNDQQKKMVEISDPEHERIICPKCGIEIISKDPNRPLGLVCNNCRSKIRIM